MRPVSSSSTFGLLLALETSQREASVALRDRAGAVHAEPLSQRKRHDDDLLPAIDRLFQRAGLTARELRDGAVCVSIGPGGFTGLRIAVATAKMFAEALSVKLLAVPSALVAAEACCEDGALLSSAGVPAETQRVCVALACKDDSLWLTRVERDRGSWRIASEPGIALAEAIELQGIDAVIADEFFPDAARQRVLAAKRPVVQPRFTAAACLRIGAEMLARDQTIDPLHLLPLYPRQPEAVTLWQQRASAGAKRG